MISTLLHLLRLSTFLCGGRRQLAIENLALRQQLAVYKRRANQPKLRRTDRLFWVWLSRLWAGWRQPLVIVTPDTVLRWQRRRFRHLSFAKTPSGGQVVDRSARVRRKSQLDDHPPAPPASLSPLPLRRPPPARPEI